MDTLQKTETLQFQNYAQQPHGGSLVNQMVSPERLEEENARARTMPMIMIDLEAIITIEMIGTGVLSPHKGFMNEDDYHSVLEKGRLTNGVVWPVPLSFAPTGERNSAVIKSLSIGDEVALVDENSDPVAILTIEDMFSYDRAHRAKNLFGTNDRSRSTITLFWKKGGSPMEWCGLFHSVLLLPANETQP